MNKIKVLHIGSPAALYGAERWILALIKNLNNYRIESIVSVIKDTEYSENSLCKEGERLGCRSVVFNSMGKINLSAIKMVRKFVQDENVHIVHTHFYKTDIVGRLATLSTPCKAISTPHGWTEEGGMKLRVYEIMDRLIYQCMDAVVPLSVQMHKSLQKILFSKKRLFLIKNGVDIEEVNKTEHIALEINELHQHGYFIFGYIGRLVKGKGVDVAIRSLAKLQGIKWKFYIIGEGEEKIKLEKMAKDLNLGSNVKFLGFRQDRLCFLKGFDAFILPSYSEGTPRCLMEAMAAGILVIASDIPGCRSLIHNKVNGLLFKPGDSEELFEIIERMALDKKLRSKISRNGMNYVLTNFSAKRMAEDYEKLYLRLSSQVE